MSNVTAIAEPIWQNTVPVSNLSDIVNAISTIGSTPTLFELNNDITLTGTYIDILNNVIVKFTSAGGPYKINADRKSAVMYIRSGCVVYLGNVIITGGNNTQNADAGGVNNIGGTLVIEDGCQVVDNYAFFYGGGILSQGGELYMEGGLVSGNTARLSAGGVFVTSNGNFTMTGGVIDSNTAGWGGGILTENTPLFISGGSITGNTAASDGGGIYIHGAGTYNIDGASILNNTAGANDGGIYIPYAALSDLNIGPSAVFSGNKAAVAYNRNPADDATYYAHVLTTHWTSPFSQGYNNYDISYMAGTPIRNFAKATISGTKSTASKR